MRIVKVKNIASTLTGFAFDSKRFNESQGVPIIRIRDLKQGFSKTYFDGNFDKRYVVKKGDLLIGMDGEFNLVEWPSIDALLNQRVCKLIIDETQADKTYIKYALPKKLKEIEDATPFVTVKHLSNKQVLEIEIPLPDLQTQKQIAQILESADYARQQRKKATALTEQFLQSSFLHLFGDLVTNTKSWPCKRLDEVANISSGVTKGRNLNGTETISVPYMRVANVQDGHLNLFEIKTIEIKPTELSKYLLQNGDILLTEGGDPDKLGRGAVWYNQIENCIHQNHIFKVRADKSLFTPEFLSMQFGSDYGKRYFLKAAKQTTGIASINSTQLKAFPVLVPPLSLQQQFASIVADTARLRQKQRESETALEHLFQALLQQYFDAEAKPVIKAVPDALSTAAEPAPPYKIATSSIPENKRGFAKYVLAGKIISECRNTKDFSHIKFQKLQHLAEYLLEEELEQNFYYQAAGPYDNKLMHNLDNKMQQQKWFAENNYVFHPLAKAPEIDGHFNRYFSNKMPVFEKLMHLLGNGSEDQCEIVSTLFAVWNDMLILKEPVSDPELIVRFYQWSDRKKKYTPEQLEKALDWMRKEELVPKGFGPLIKHKKK